MQTNGVAMEKQAISSIGLKRPIRLVVGGYFGFNNLGDEAILSTMLGQIRSHVGEASIVVASGNPAETERTHGVRSIDRLDIKALDEEVCRCDLAILGGGGLFQNYNTIEAGNLFIKPNNEVVSYAVLPLLAKMHGKPVLFYSQGFGPLFTHESRTFTAFISSLADSIAVRDTESVELLKDLGVPEARISLSADPAVCMALPPVENTDAILSSEGIPAGRQIIVISVRWWIDESSNEWLRRVLPEALDRILEADERYIAVFVPFQIQEGSSDLQISDEVLAKMKNKGRCYAIRGPHSPEEMAGIFSRARLAIGMRYHALVFSLIARVPFVAISYADKVRDFARELAMERYCVDMGSCDSMELSRVIGEALANDAAIRNSLNVSLHGLKNRAEITPGLILPCIEGSQGHNTIESDRMKALISESRFLRDVYYDLRSQLNESEASKQALEHQLKDNEVARAVVETRLKDNEASKQALYQQLLDSETARKAVEQQLMDSRNAGKATESRLKETKALLKEKESELSMRNDNIRILSSELKYLEADSYQLRDTVRRMENSVSWRFSQYYGRFFSMKSPLTRMLRGALSTVIQGEKPPIAPHADTSSSTQSPAIPEKKDNILHEQELDAILEEHEGKVKGIIIYPPTVDWNIPLFQRPQQLALELSRYGYLFFFSTGSNQYDKVDGFRKITDRCYITDQYDLIVKRLPKFILMLSSTNLVLGPHQMQEIDDRAFIVYEYIDEIHEDISGNDQISMMKKRHESMIGRAEVFITTADNLYKETIAKREKGVYLIPNGVDYEHFHINRDPSDIPGDLKDILARGKPIIGYYGALAKWFDYELVKKVALRCPDYEIVLIGWNYDNSMKDEHLEQYDNIHYLGIKDYPILPKYAVWFDVSTIPFVLNKITESTSPIKVFEYMALQTPIVTTDLRECRKYGSVLIGTSHDDFIEKLKEALKKRSDPEYLELLKKEALDNTWEKRAVDISRCIESAGALSTTPNVGGQ